jgi:hypothetical protein
MVLSLIIATLLGGFLALLSLWFFRKMMTRHTIGKVKESLEKSLAQIKSEEDQSEADTLDFRTETREWFENRKDVVTKGLKFIHSYLPIIGGFSLGLLGFTAVPTLFHFYIVNIDPEFKFDPMMLIWQGRMQFTALFLFMSIGILMSGLQRRIRRSLENEIVNTRIFYEQKINELESKYEKAISELTQVNQVNNDFLKPSPTKPNEPLEAHAPQGISKSSSETIQAQKRDKNSTGLFKGLRKLVGKRRLSPDNRSEGL